MDFQESQSTDSFKLLQSSPVDLTRIEETLGQLYAEGMQEEDSEDIQAVLAQRERDLMLAAEVGKALLQKNQELQQQHDTFTAEYNRHLEALEQEKYALKRRLDNVEAIYESRVVELQADVSALRNQLTDEQSNAKSACKDNDRMVEELTEQNQRLTQQLKQACKTEDHLSQQLCSLREQFSLRRLALHEHIQQLEGLREEIQQLTEKKVDLERRIITLTEERDCMSDNLEDTSLKALMLERQNKEAEHNLRLKETELQDVKRENVGLRMNLQELQINKSINETIAAGLKNDFDAAVHNSLFNELEMAEHLEADAINSPLCGSQRMNPGFFAAANIPPELLAFNDDDDDNIECDDDFEPVLPDDHHDANTADMNFYARLHNSDDEHTYQLKQEILKVYKQIKTIVKPGERAYDVIGGDEDRSQALLAANDMKPDLLIMVLGELKGLMEDIVSREIDMAKQLKQVEEEKTLSDQQSKAARAHLDSVKEQVSYCRQRLEQMSVQLEQRQVELKKKDEEMSDLQQKCALQRAELSKILEERNMLRSDRDSLQSSKEEAVAKAWKEREDAVEKKNTVELELTKAQIELMTLDSQLMEAIKQKIQLSQQLEAWQMDMASVIEGQVKSKLEEEQKRKAAAMAASNCSQQPNSGHKKSASWFSTFLTMPTTSTNHSSSTVPVTTSDRVTSPNGDKRFSIPNDATSSIINNNADSMDSHSENNNTGYCKDNNNLLYKSNEGFSHQNEQVH